MKNLFYGLLALSMGSLWILNFFSGIVGGIWLIASGGLGLVIAGVIVGFIMPFAYSIAFLPNMLFMPLLSRAVEKGSRFWGAVLAFLLGGYNNFITVIWVIIVFEWFMYDTRYPAIAMWLFGYSVVMAPLSYMASKEGSDAGAGTIFGVLFAQVAYFLLSINLFLGGAKETGYAWLWLLLLVYTLFITWMGVQAVPKKTKGESSSDGSGVDPLMSNALDIVAQYELVSAPLFQRKLSIGFDRAINILNTLTVMNFIEGGDAEAPRKVLVNKSEIEKLKDYFESLPKYDPSQFEEVEPVAPLNEKDSIYPQVKEFVRGKKEITVADLQKKFDIGYSRGARIMDHLEEDGFVDSPIGTTPRKVLVAWQTADKNINQTGLMIVETLKAFGIFTRIEEINKKKEGMQYCLEVAVGSSISGIEKLDKDIAMAVASPTGKVKIQAPIPGRSLIGITIPIKKT